MDRKKWLQAFERKRNAIRALRAKGATLEKIAMRFGISRQRVHEICKAEK